jgi:hypothetical protein
MVEVVNYSVESPKCVRTRFGSQKLLLETRKPDYPVSLISTTARGTVDVDEEDLPPSKRRLDGGEGRTTINPRGCGSGY